MLDVRAPSRASPLPHGLQCSQIMCSQKIPVGAGKPAMNDNAVYRLGTRHKYHAATVR